MGHEIPETFPVMYLGNIDGVVMREDLYLFDLQQVRNWLNINIPKQKQWLEIVQREYILKEPEKN